jgi:hypothetical protein
MTRIEKLPKATSMRVDSQLIATPDKGTTAGAAYMAAGLELVVQLGNLLILGDGLWQLFHRASLTRSP